VTLSALDAAALVRPVDTLGFGLGPANPHALLAALSARDDFEDLVLGGALLLGLFDVLARRGVRYRCGFYGPVERLYKAKGADIQLVPAGFRQFGSVLERFSPRVMAVQCAPPDAEGRLNLSLHFGATRDALLASGRDPNRVLICEVNAALPRTSALRGFDNTLPLDLVDVVVETDTAPVELPEPVITDADERIAEHCVELIPERATLQTGIGAIPSLVAAKLAEGSRGSFGVHSEMFTTGLMALHQAGKVTNAFKGQFEGVSVTTFALGTAELYRWLDDNVDVAFGPVSVVNDPSVLRRNAGSSRSTVRSRSISTARSSPTRSAGGRSLAWAATRTSSRLRTSTSRTTPSSACARRSTCTASAAAASWPVSPRARSSPPRVTTSRRS
jgi:acyl-CoA hydrolase